MVMEITGKNPDERTRRAMRSAVPSGSAVRIPWLAPIKGAPVAAPMTDNIRA